MLDLLGLPDVTMCLIKEIFMKVKNKKDKPKINPVNSISMFEQNTILPLIWEK